MRNPKVFISHASEDKERFVLDLAKKLRGKGIDAWLDKWEMLLGDDVVGKVFEEGIKNSQVVIVVLSPHSVNKKFPKAERDVAVIKKINGEIRVIPVVLDIEKDEVPESLKSTFWIRIDDTRNYDKELNEIIRAIYGYSEKPPLGTPPQYVRTSVHLLTNLTKTDTIIFKIACEEAIKLTHMGPFDGSEIFPICQSFGIDEEMLWVSLHAVDRRGLIDLRQDMGASSSKPSSVWFTITDYGFEEYLRVYLEDYNTVTKLVKSRIVNYEEMNDTSIADSTDIPVLVVDHILKALARNGLVQIYEPSNGRVYVTDYNPEMKRL